MKLYQNRLIIAAVAAVAIAIGVHSLLWHLHFPAIYSSASRSTVGDLVQQDDPLSTIRPASHPKNHLSASQTVRSIEPWSGMWRGQWEGTLDAYFVALEQEGSRVEAFYSWGTNLIVTKPGQRFMSGVAMGEVLTFPIHSGNSLVFKMISGSAHIEAVHYTPNSERPSRAVFTKIKNMPLDDRSTGPVCSLDCQGAKSQSK